MNINRYAVVIVVKDLETYMNSINLSIQSAADWKSAVMTAFEQYKEDKKNESISLEQYLYVDIKELPVCQINYNLQK